MGRKINEIVPKLTSFDEVQAWLQDIVDHHNDVYPAILDIADFFNHVYRDTEELDDGGIYYQINDSKIVSVVYNTTTIDITYKTTNNEERTIKFHTNLQRESTEVNGSIVQLVSYNNVQDDGDYAPLTVGDAYIDNGKLYVLTRFEDETPIYTQSTLKVNVLYLRKTGNKIYYYDGEEVHEFNIGGGGGPSVVFDEAFNYAISRNSDNAVRAKHLWAAYQDIMNTIQGLDGGKKTLNGLETVDADGESFDFFDYTKGNPGIFKFDKEPEEITVEDVRNAVDLSLPDSFVQLGYNKIEDIPIINDPEDNRTGLWTASKVGLSNENTAQSVTNLRNAIEDVHCLGIVLDKMYTIPAPSGTFSKITDPISFYNNCTINIKKDFIFVGDDSIGFNASERPGFYVQWAFLYTEYSLLLKNIDIVRSCTNQDGNYRSIYINTVRGIDQLQIIGCKLGKQKEDTLFDGNILMLYSPNTLPFKLFEGENMNDGTYKRSYNNEIINVREVYNYNYINNIYIDGNNFFGSSCLYFYNIRNVKSCRIIDNTCRDFTRTPIEITVFNFSSTASKAPMLTTPNPPDYNFPITIYSGDVTSEITGPVCFLVLRSSYYTAQTKAYMSCPRYIVNNRFIGNEYCLADGRGGDYYAAILTEGGTDFILHNYITNIVGTVKFSSGSHKVIPCYDMYNNVQQIYSANNYAENIVSFNNYKDDSDGYAYSDGLSGILKAKSLNLTYVQGGMYLKDLIRYYKNNTYKLDKDKVLTWWNQHIESINPSTDADEYNYKHGIGSHSIGNTEVIKALSIHIANPVYRDDKVSRVAFPTRGTDNNGYPVIKEFRFEGNIVDAGDGYIWGMRNNQEIPASKFICCDNKFIAKRFPNETTWDGYNGNNGYIFSVKLATLTRLGKSQLLVMNNTFRDNCISSEDGNLINTDKETSLRFVVNSYYTHEVDDTMAVSHSEGDISSISNNVYEGEKGLYIKVYKANQDNSGYLTVIKSVKFPLKLASENLVFDNLYGDSGKVINYKLMDYPNLNDHAIDIVDGEKIVKKCTSPGSSAKINVKIVRNNTSSDFPTLSVNLTTFKLRLLEDEIIYVGDDPIKLTNLRNIVRAYVNTLSNDRTDPESDNYDADYESHYDDDPYSNVETLDHFAQRLLGTDYSSQEVTDGYTGQDDNTKKAFLSTYIQTHTPTVIIDNAPEIANAIGWVIKANDYVQVYSTTGMTGQVGTPGTFLVWPTNGPSAVATAKYAYSVVINTKKRGAAYAYCVDKIASDNSTIFGTGSSKLASPPYGKSSTSTAVYYSIEGSAPVWETTTVKPGGLVLELAELNKENEDQKVLIDELLAWKRSQE